MERNLLKICALTVILQEELEQVEGFKHEIKQQTNNYLKRLNSWVDTMHDAPEVWEQIHTLTEAVRCKVDEALQEGE